MPSEFAAIMKIAPPCDWITLIVGYKTFPAGVFPAWLNMTYTFPPHTGWHSYKVSFKFENNDVHAKLIHHFFILAQIKTCNLCLPKWSAEFVPKHRNMCWQGQSNLADRCLANVSPNGSVHYGGGPRHVPPGGNRWPDAPPHFNEQMSSRYPLKKSVHHRVPPGISPLVSSTGPDPMSNLIIEKKATQHYFFRLELKIYKYENSSVIPYVEREKRKSYPTVREIRLLEKFCTPRLTWFSHMVALSQDGRDFGRYFLKDRPGTIHMNSALNSPV